MLLRPLDRVIPRNKGDIGCILLVAIFLPITYVFEMTVVLPEVHEIGSGFYIFTWLAGLFLIFNLTGNMLACMLVDTSIRTAMLKPPSNPDKLRLWHMCVTCEALVPPRSWHCADCKTCVLKRDHHCRFTGCCVGHHNYRYFIYFLIYMCIGTAYATLYNSIYLWYLHADIYFTKTTLVTLVFPLLAFFIDSSISNLYLLIYILNVVGFLLSLTLIAYHSPIVSKGAVSYKREKEVYNLGLMQNIEMLLGERWQLTWLSPFIRSELPHNGVDWDPIKQL